MLRQLIRIPMVLVLVQPGEYEDDQGGESWSRQSPLWDLPATPLNGYLKTWSLTYVPRCEEDVTLAVAVEHNMEWTTSRVEVELHSLGGNYSAIVIQGGIDGEGKPCGEIGTDSVQVPAATWNALAGYETLNVYARVWTDQFVDDCETADLQVSLDLVTEITPGAFHRTNGPSYHLWRSWRRVRLPDGSWDYVWGYPVNDPLNHQGLICQIQSGQIAQWTFSGIGYAPSGHDVDMPPAGATMAMGVVRRRPVIVRTTAAGECIPY